MALSSQEQHDVIRYLGWPGKTIVANSISYNTQVADRVSNMPIEMENQTRKLMDRLVTLDEKLEKALCRASTKQVDDITLNENEFSMLRGERKRVVSELSDLLDIPVMSSSNNMVNICL
jgi:hypothetical protein